ncbi:MAG TPA: TetR/AcrR family transcriptional regulator [Polyangiales bacterium]|nr:TetR/AcrR family transcriptional regulator [Polyangiales bacterium]
MTKSTEPVQPVAAAPSRRRNPTESKRRILDAAERAFALRGYEGARLRDIAQEAGVHHALLHHYYGDKRGLFREVVQRALSNLSLTGFAQLSASENLEGTARALVSALVDFFAAHRDLMHIIEGAFRERGSEAQQLAAGALREFVSPLLTGIVARIRDAQKRGTVRNDMEAPVILQFGFAALATPFVLRGEILDAIGVGRPAYDKLEEHKQALSQYLIAALSPPQPS